mmetsp:Transcript_19164/g.22077  ORF Transcript_19164/g.22077 Transcript_19164/m.22077 type:complete len:456 (+) Transcript_19164:127-1494(+)|eukprot:CAMPEP_0194380420 /NCGR_PEP_ID=MMETSP0174-20130528/44927_1 /TAXON_ID=216777 /ORGANISM="Proboscia alata, Strain PI-D3" /LENGTH=455 /DNA_ID=CAMNT_0039163805 /DNA_START=123 /DNA_END=1490 /DNA_ORIENTATION=+
MKITVKTLKGEKFIVDAEPSNSVAEVKGIVEKAKAELPAANMKLIHSGKVLKDDATIESCNIKPTDFLVVMITKAKKAAPAAPATAPATPAAAASAAAPTAPAKDTSAAAPSSTPAPATPAPAPATPAPAADAAATTDNFPAEVITNLTGMGFPEAEVRACLRASGGNPDVAVEFLMNGIPPGIPTSSTTTTPAGSSGGGGSLAALRSHPQFDALRRLVQSNPQSLQAVLTQIGQQQPELLQEINSNQAAFLEMMNEPVSDTPATTSSTTTPASVPPAAGSNPAGMLQNLAAGGGIADPAQMAQMLSNLNPTELNEMASMMGLTPQQLTATAQMIGQMPPEQLQQYMMHAMGGQGGAGAEGMPGGGLPGLLGGGGMGGQQVVRLNEEEMAAVDRLVDMGFDRSEAAQAFLACDKNEALAANLLMDSAGEGGFFGGGGGGGAGNADGGGNDDDMYE